MTSVTLQHSTAGSKRNSGTASVEVAEMSTTSSGRVVLLQSLYMVQPCANVRSVLAGHETRLNSP